MALRLCIERLVPPRRSGSAALELPEIAKAEDVAEGERAVIAVAARGDLTLAEAREWMALLDKQRAAIENEDLGVRVEMLEGELKRKDARR